MTLKKFQEACIFNLNEKKPSGEFKYKKVKSCIDSTMKKYSLGKEILGFTMCVRDKPIGLSLIETRAHLTVHYSVVQAVRRPCDWYLSSEIIPDRVFSFKRKKVPSYITEKLSLQPPQFPANNKMVNFEVTDLNLFGCEIVYDGEITCQRENCYDIDPLTGQNGKPLDSLCIRTVFKKFFIN